MQVTIYLDSFFWVNFIADWIVLILTALVRKRRIRFCRITAASFLGAGIMLPFIKIPSLLMGKTGILICLATELCAVTFAMDQRDGEWMRNGLTAIAIQFFLGGMMGGMRSMTGIYKVTFCCWMVMLMASAVLCYGTAHFLNQTAGKEDYIYRIAIRTGEKWVKDYVYLDTGNLLWDPLFMKPVIVVGEELAGQLLTRDERKVVEEYKKKRQLPYETIITCESQKRVCFHEITYQSVGKNSGKLLCFLAEEICIRGLKKKLKKQPVAIAPSVLFDGKKYNGLLCRDFI